ncbi:MAG: YdcF family protein [Clostridiales bacterium]|nr:YdcF family protein [Clostridiales bacterium]
MKQRSVFHTKFPLKRLSGFLLLLAAAFFGLALKGYTYLALAFLVLSLLCFAFDLLEVFARKKPESKAPLRLKRILQVCTVLGLCVFLFFEIPVIAGAFGSADREEDPDYLIVLGAGLRGDVPSVTLRDRLRTAADFLKEHPDTIAIVSGGQGPDETISEALAMKRWLVQSGIPEARIVMENRSTSTYENLTFSLAIIESLRTDDEDSSSAGSGEPVIAILSSEYHMYRASLMAGELGLADPQMVPASTSLPFLKTAYFIREAAGLARYRILGY